MGTKQFSEAEAAGLLADRGPTVGAMLTKRIAAGPERDAFMFPDERGGWQTLSWKGVGDQTSLLAGGLLALGLNAEDRVSIACTTRVEWILTDLAIMCAGGATTTIYPTTKHDDFAYILGDSGSRIVVVEDDEQLAKLQQHRELFDELLGVVLIDGNSDLEKVHSWAELKELGEKYLAEHPEAVNDAIAATRPDSLSTLIYTSGTTGRPKGVRLSHDAWAYEGRAVQIFDLIGPDDLQYLWLPLSHVFGKALLAVQLEIGFSTAVDGRIDKIVDGLGEVHPTFMCGAPRIFEKVRNKVMMGTATGAKSKIARWAFSVGQRTAPYRLQGKEIPRGLALQYKLADKLVFSKLKEKMGGRMKYMVSGSAKLSSQVQDWFYAAGLMIFEGYGMTETSAITFVNDPRMPRFGSVGPAMPGTECKIAEDGEILVRGPGVMIGYHHLDDATAEVLTDGWLHTGDIGELDDEGFLRITDRKKDLIKTSGGKYVAPQKVESVMVANCPYISQVVVHGEGRKYVTALFTLDPEALEDWAGEQEDSSLRSLTYADLTRHDAVHAMVQRYVDAANERLERWETVKKFTILPAELSVDQGEVTPSLKVKRKQVEKNHASSLDSLYDED